MEAADAIWLSCGGNRHRMSHHAGPKQAMPRPDWPDGAFELGQSLLRRPLGRLQIRL